MLNSFQHASTCVLRPNRSVDDKTIGFQGRYKEKQKIKFKREGDGFMADCCCKNGFMHSFYFRNMPAPIKCLRLKLSPLCIRVLGLLIALSHSNCRYWADNFHIPDKFLCAP